MAISQKPPPAEKSDPGFRDEFSSFIAGIKSYVMARGELFSIEAREAAAILGRKSGLGGAALFLLFFGYLLLAGAATGILGQLLNPDVPLQLRGWIGGALILAFIHIVGGILILLKLKRTGRNMELFEVTRSEFRKDQEWLNKDEEN